MADMDAHGELPTLSFDAGVMVDSSDRGPSAVTTLVDHIESLVPWSHDDILTVIGCTDRSRSATDEHLSVAERNLHFVLHVIEECNEFLDDPTEIDRAFRDSTGSLVSLATLQRSDFYDIVMSSAESICHVPADEPLPPALVAASSAARQHFTS